MRLQAEEKIKGTSVTKSPTCKCIILSKSLVVHHKKELSVGKEWFGLQEQMRCQQGKKY